MEQTDGRKVNLRGEETVDNFKKDREKDRRFPWRFYPKHYVFGNFPYLYGNDRIQIFFSKPL